MNEWSGRPADRVRQFLDDHIASLPDSGRFRLPTARVLAEQLQVSPQTILNVYREYASDGRVETRAGDGTFVTRQGSGQPVRDRLCIGISDRGDQAVGRADDWGRSIYASLMQATMGLQPQVALVPLDVSEAGEYSLDRLREQITSVDGLILQPSMIIRDLCEQLRPYGRPIVTFNAPDDQALADFVSPNYFAASRRVGHAWRMVGRKRLMLVSTRELSTSVSTRQRLYGLLAGLDVAYPSQVQMEVEMAHGSSLEHGLAVGRRLMSRGQPLPDAIYCIGDYQAMGIHQVLVEQGVDVPGEVSLIGGTGLNLSATTCPNLTRTYQDITQTAQSLVAMAVKRILEPHAVTPGRYIDMPLVGGATTTSAENRHLGLATATASTVGV